MKNTRITDTHGELISEGLELYDAYKYKEALPYLEQAYLMKKDCVCAMYNFANVLHMLNRGEEAYEILSQLISKDSKQAKEDCCEVESPRGFIIDAHFLLFLVLIHYQGFSDEAFKYADLHLELRTRGVKSVWTKEYVKNEISNYMEEWKDEA